MEWSDKNETEKLNKNSLNQYRYQVYIEYIDIGKR